MPRKYVPGLKLRPGDAAGQTCEAPGCTRTTSSYWHAHGRCCTSDGCTEYFGVGKFSKKRALGDATNVIASFEAVLANADYAAAAAAMASGGAPPPPVPPPVPVVEATAVVVEPQAEALAEAEQRGAAEGEARAVAAEARAAEAEARAADAVAKLERMLGVVFEDLMKERGDDGMSIEERDVRRWTGLTPDEIRPHTKALKGTLPYIAPHLDQLPENIRSRNIVYVYDD